jgi:hypothetical protein
MATDGRSKLPADQPSRPTPASSAAMPAETFLSFYNERLFVAASQLTIARRYTNDNGNSSAILKLTDGATINTLCNNAEWDRLTAHLNRTNAPDRPDDATLHFRVGEIVDRCIEAHGNYARAYHAQADKYEVQALQETFHQVRACSIRILITIIRG